LTDWSARGISRRPELSVDLREETMTAPANDEFRLGYRPWLDGMRGVAILLVLALHFGVLPGGFLGVDVFFVLSGFLITVLLAEEWRDRGSIDFRRFYLRRALRLLPAYAVLLAVVAARLFFVTGDEVGNTIRELLVAGCYFANWPSLHGVGMLHLRHTWSLCVEEQFYLIWPIVFWTMLRFRMSRPRILAVVVAGIFLSALDRLLLYWLLKQSDRMGAVFRLYMGLDSRADALLIGCLIGLLAAWGYLRNRDGLGLRLAALVAIGLLGWILSARGIDNAPLYRYEFTVIALLIGILLVRLVTASSASTTLLGRVLEAPPLLWIGRRSYAIYLFHLPIIDGLGVENKAWSEPGRCLLAGALALGAAALSYVVVEQPFLRLKSRFATRLPNDAPGETPSKRAA
jgi:peptidoglycan/LPS O-acetylase OafA/YrhL